jgi:hypothetical protein
MFNKMTLAFLPGMLYGLFTFSMATALYLECCDDFFLMIVGHGDSFLSGELAALEFAVTVASDNYPKFHVDISILQSIHGDRCLPVMLCLQYLHWNHAWRQLSTSNTAMTFPSWAVSLVTAKGVNYQSINRVVLVS